MASAWVGQDPHQVKKHGTEEASWYVYWLNPEGRQRSKTCGPGARGKDRAERLRRKIENELMCGQYREKINTTWATFRQQYEDRVLAGLAPRSRVEVQLSLNHFERLAKPEKVFNITTFTIDNFVAARRQERGKKKGSLVSPATVNKDLRQIEAALHVALEWQYLPQLPKFRVERVPRKLPVYMTAEHLAAIYVACDKARFPKGLPYPAADWWRGLLIMAYMTGWRISDLLGLKRQDVDLEAGTAVTRFEDNKGKRDELVRLHPVVVEHLKRLPGFDPCTFPWYHSRRYLHVQFARVQEAAGIHLPCRARGEHEHTRFCYVYGFHDLRRAFATMNADKLTPDALQALMRHKSYRTTQIYINMARQIDTAVENLHVPDFLKKAGQGGLTLG